VGIYSLAFIFDTKTKKLPASVSLSSSKMIHRLSRQALSTTARRCFTTVDGPFNSKTITVDTTDYDKNFQQKLTTAVQAWSNCDQTNAAWLHLQGPTEAELLPQALRANFVYHHALDDTVVLCQWLQKKINKIPPYATHQIGCAGVVTKGEGDDMEVLLIREPRSFEQWKLPGGVADKGEEWSVAAEREVFEETGIRATFSNVMCIRNQHNLSFGKSDVYVVCHLILNETTEQDDVIQIDEDEIDEAKWWTVREWQKMTSHPINIHVIEQLTKKNTTCIQEEVSSLKKGSGKEFRLYSPCQQQSTSK